jgi:hypothetical protein
MSPDSFTARPTLRAAVPARLIVPALNGLSAKNAPKTVAPIEIAVESFDWFACSRSRPSACSARRLRSSSDASLGA